MNLPYQQISFYGQPHRQSTPSNSGTQSHSLSINTSTLPVPTCEQYMWNYTYLEYCKFPELFATYIQKLDYQQLASLFDSYINTLVEFFTEGANYSVSYQGVLMGEYFVDRVSNKLKGINMKKNASTKEMIESLQREVQRLRQEFNRGKIIDITILAQLTRTIDFLELQYQLSDIVQKIKKDSLTNALFNLIIIMIKHLVKNNCRPIINKFFKFKHIIYAALWKITQENKKDLEQNPSLQYLIDVLQIRITPIEIELKDFYDYVKSSMTKESQLFGLLNGAVGNVGMYLKIFSLVKSIDQLITDFKRKKITDRRFDVPNKDNLSLSKVITIVQQCIKAGDIVEDLLMEGQSIQRRNMETMKELTVENVEKIAKLLMRVSFQNKEDQIDEEKNTILRKSTGLNKKKQSMHQEIDMRKLLDSEFLLTYKELCILTFGIQETVPNHHNKNEQIIITLSDLIQKLFQNTNKKIKSVCCLVPKKLLDIREKIELSNYECALLIEAVNDVNDRIKGLVNDKQLKTKEDVQKLQERLIKVKDSLLTNVLTLKVLHSAFEGQHTSHLKQNEIQPEEQAHQSTIKDLNQISELFSQIMQFSIQQGNSQQQIRTLPCLQNILLMFAAIQLWNQLIPTNNIISQQQTSARKQISQLMQKIIKQYSQQNVKIDTNEIVFVESILTLLQVYQDVDQRADIHKVDEYLVKLIEMKRNKGLNTADVVNSKQSLQAILEILALKLLSQCFPKNSITNRANNQLTQAEFSEGLYKIPIWQIITLSPSSNDLKSQQVVSFIINNIKQPSKNIFTTNLQPVILSDKSSNTPIVNIDQVSANNTKILTTVMRENPGSSQKQLFQIFLELKDKFQRLIWYKQQLRFQNVGEQQDPISQSKQLKKQSLGNVFDKQRSEMMRFYLGSIDLMYKSWSRISTISLQLNTFSASHPSLSQLILNQLHTLSQQLTQFTLNHITSFSTLILQPKLALFKPSAQQLSHLIHRANLSSDNAQKMNEKITQLQKVYNSYVEWGMFVLGYLSWVKMEAVVKVQMMRESGVNKRKYPKVELSSQLLLQTITILSLCISDNFHPNFQSLQSHLQSNIQPTPKPPQSTLMSSHYFPFLPLNKKSVKTHIQHMGSFQFIQFIYEFIPFDINSEDQQMELYNLSVEFAGNHDNHQFLNPQKAEKIRLNKIGKYLGFLRQEHEMMKRK